MGLVGVLVILGVSGEALPADGQSLVFAAVAGTSGVIGLGCFYYALARGTMGVVAPLAAVIGAGVPVAIDLYGGDVLTQTRLGGVALALVAVALISLPGGEQSADERRRRRLDLAELPLVVGSGLGFAGFFVFMDHASAQGAVWWPLAIVRIVGLALVAVAFVFFVARARGRLRQRVGRIVGAGRLRENPPSVIAVVVVLVVAGIGDLGGNAFFVLATQSGQLSVAVTLSSLYPVVTTLLAAVLLHERLRRLQLIGVGLATLSVALLR